MSKHSTEKLTIKYKVFGSHDVNSYLDNKIEKIANACGLEFQGSGYNFLTKERDLEFESPVINIK